MAPAQVFPPARWPELPIRTGRLVLRLPRSSDVDEIVRACSQRRVSRGIPPMPHPYHRADGLAFVRGARHGFQRRLSIPLAVTEGVHEPLVGMVELSLLNAIHRRGEIGYWIDPSRWGRGYATEVAHALCSVGFRKLRLHRIESGAMAWNHSSLRVLHKLGFQEEGRLRDHFRIGAKWVTAIRLGLLAGELQ
ncbi:MAG: GNAT family N-acetyltransferase [Thermoplasmata archaeon]|nr:GNAT family N-acetyltransferase [Thermoplasmata archaeon]